TSSEESSAASGQIAGCCLRPVRVPALPPRSTHRWRARFSCWKSLCGGLGFGSGSGGSGDPGRPSGWPRGCLGRGPVFLPDALAYASAEATPLFFALGAVAGLAAIAYNRALLETITAAERLGRLSVELRAGLIGAAVGTLAWFAPSVVGGGDAITQRALVGAETLAVLPLLFLLRFGLGTVSYAA